MAESLNAALAFVAACLIACAPALAQGTLADPTRPPTVSPAAPGAAGGAAPAEAPSPRLQSVLLSPTRKLAMIDGRSLSIGEKVSDATLVHIAETHVVLKRPEGTSRLELTPGIARQPVKLPAKRDDKKKGTRP